MQLKIVDKMLFLLNKRLEENYYKVEFSPRLKHWILDSAYSPNFGARPIKRFIQNEVETKIATAIIQGKLSTKIKYLVDYVDDEVTITPLQ